MGGNIGLSSTCRFRLTNSLCSLCDGDVVRYELLKGERIKKGVCPHYCRQFYDDCKDDYFAFESNNQLKVCKVDDIICSKLSDILPESQKE
jgi:hypothetical protein